MTPKERLHATIRGQTHDRVPVTPIFMAWAAHYIGRTYRDFYLDGDVLAQAQLAVTKAFDVDQTSAISDPWRDASGYGMQFDYPEQGVGIPKDVVLKSPDDVSKLGPIDIEAAPRMKQRIESVAQMAAQVGRTHSVLGWVEGPMCEYAELRGLTDAMMDLVESPEAFNAAARVLVDNALEFARRQIQAGADTIGFGDAAASLIGPALYRDLVLPWERVLIDGIHDAGALVKLHICGNIIGILEHIPASGADVVDVDWMVPLAEARRLVGPAVTLCGNFDPSEVLLRGTPQDVAEAARQCIADGGERFILQPGCEVPQGTPEANIRSFCPGEGCLIADALRL